MCGARYWWNLTLSAGEIMFPQIYMHVDPYKPLIGT